MKLNLFKQRVVCLHCQSETDTPVTVQKLSNGKRVKLHFCTETCANIFYLERLRGVKL